MAVLRLRAPLSELVGGLTQVEVEGTSVAAALAALERAHPALTGWIVDGQRALRPHINIFVDGALAGLETQLHPASRVHILPAITGGTR